MNTTISKVLTVVFTAVLFVSCDKDYNTIGGDIIGGENFEINGEEFGINVYNRKLETAIQTNNLAINQLGVYNNPTFGKTEANFVTQLSLAETAPAIGKNAVIDSVVLSIPYFSKRNVATDGKVSYELKRINGTGAIDLAVYTNDYELLDLNPDENFETGARYYSDQDDKFNARKKGLSEFSSEIGDNRLNDRIYDSNTPKVRSENKNFVPSNKEIIIYKVETKKTTDNPYVTTHTPTEDVETRLAPEMRLRLNKEYFDKKIINPGADSIHLKNNIDFKKYFKGLYFQAKEVDASNGSLMSLDFKKGTVKIYYKEDKKVKNAAGVVIGNDRPMKTLTLTMTGNTVNLYGPSVSMPIEQTAFAAEDLYIKGGAGGSLAFVELFSDADKLLELKDKKVLLNEASLLFTVNAQKMEEGTNHPFRIYVYDADNETIIYDYAFDTSTDTSTDNADKAIFGGMVKEEKTGDVVTKRTYKIRITHLVDKILKGEQKNVRLGVVVTENINDASNRFVKGTGITLPKSDGSSAILKKIPSASVYNPLGTVLHGSTGENRVKFIINYTKTN